MTLAEQLTSDVTDVFLNTTEFAESVAWTACGAISATTYTMIVDRGNQMERVKQADGTFLNSQVDLHMATDGTNGPSSINERDTANIDGATYRYAAITDEDADMRVVQMVLIDPREKSAERYRLNRTG